MIDTSDIPEVGEEWFKHAILVTPRCGCVFCDIGLPAIKLKRQWIHRVGKGGWRTVVCTLKTYGVPTAMSEGSKPRS